MINALDGVPSDNKCWFGYGVYDSSQLFLHQYSGNWFEGTPKGTVNTGSGDTFTLGVARINDSYYVFVNGVLALTEKVAAYSVSGDHTTALPADNASGFGLFIGSNFSESGGAKTSFTDFNYTMDINEIAAMVGGSTVSYDTSLMTVKQFGKSVLPGGSVVQGTPAQIELNVPADMVVENLELKFNGRPFQLSRRTAASALRPFREERIYSTSAMPKKGKQPWSLPLSPTSLPSAAKLTVCIPILSLIRQRLPLPLRI